MNNVIVWDIETVPDLKGFAAANGHDGKADDEIRAAMGDKFPKHIYHSIICIGALVSPPGGRSMEGRCTWLPTYRRTRREGADRVIRGADRRTVAATRHLQWLVL
jgi:hypothetical protein